MSVEGGPHLVQLEGGLLELGGAGGPIADARQLLELGGEAGEPVGAHVAGAALEAMSGGGQSGDVVPQRRLAHPGHQEPGVGEEEPGQFDDWVGLARQG